ncbi:MAG: SGNH/GDSL hydrolase family protein [Verrucomicrobia bacterium]|nr:SGNH/GDSL hydrolase family protein [Verrucomicrobiota bacterium]MBU1733983.1 SGNH/GDSL hydrolase family protein [Verrucomicrobiota bacterium]MBU1857964.1 SGNH/GDSL hydrolase family protein [Verrucomicrobiota bacterium]
MATQIRNGQKIVFIGDSITDCGRRDSQRPLGAGYVKLFADLMIIREPAKRITIINKGIGGDNVVGLRNRWMDDVLRNRPDWLSIKIGINDLHGHLFAGSKELAPQPYEAAYREIMERTRQALPKCRILLIDPFYISCDTAPNSRRKQVLDSMPDYLSIVDRLSRTFKTRHIKTHELFGRLLKCYEPDTFCAEPVHPNPTGHLVIAEAIYEALS